MKYDRDYKNEGRKNATQGFITDCVLSLLGNDILRNRQHDLRNTDLWEQAIMIH